jgi:hypothetical protein
MGCEWIKKSVWYNGSVWSDHSYKSFGIELKLFKEKTWYQYTQMTCEDLVGGRLVCNMLVKNSKFSVPYILETPEPPFLDKDHSQSTYI